MVNFLKVAPSTDPVKNEDELLSYAKKLNSIADFLHCDVMSSNFVGHDTINHETIKNLYGGGAGGLTVLYNSNCQSLIVTKSFSYS